VHRPSRSLRVVSRVVIEVNKCGRRVVLQLRVGLQLDSTPEKDNEWRGEGIARCDRLSRLIVGMWVVRFEIDGECSAFDRVVWLFGPGVTSRPLGVPKAQTAPAAEGPSQSTTPSLWRSSPLNRAQAPQTQKRPSPLLPACGSCFSFPLRHAVSHAPPRLHHHLVATFTLSEFALHAAAYRGHGRPQKLTPTTLPAR
jgi:hypothetical protein